MVEEQNLSKLKESIVFLNMEELRNICIKLSIPNKGKKRALIARIIYFIKTKEIIKEPQIPEISKAKKGQIYSLHPDRIILKGAYKNDLKTRLFFKELIGDYFHFTAFGIDWLNERWLDGNPPTYQEFSNMWINEYARRKKSKANPKEEWAYIGFIQKYLNTHPKASHKEITKAWELERLRNVKIVDEVISSLYFHPLKLH